MGEGAALAAGVVNLILSSFCHSEQAQAQRRISWAWSYPKATGITIIQRYLPWALFRPAGTFPSGEGNRSYNVTRFLTHHTPRGKAIMVALYARSRSVVAAVERDKLIERNH